MSEILRLKCTKFDFDNDWGSAPDPAGGACSASPDPLTGFQRPTSKGREGKGRGMERKRWEGRYKGRLILMEERPGEAGGEGEEMERDGRTPWYLLTPPI